MCTVTIIARRNGYYLGMNRDEKLTRPAGLTPRKRIVNGRTVLCPSERTGGTWIALNKGGVSFGLINWYSVTNRVERDTISRGEVVKSVSASESPHEAEIDMRKLALLRINPFRLIGVFPAWKSIVEWRWNLERLVRIKRPWKTQQWVSSCFDELKAQKARGNVFRAALRRSSRGSLGWLHQLHRSHSPRCGPFSTCMHRSDAATVSYTEITVSGNHGGMNYHAGPLCNALVGKCVEFY